MMTGVPPILSEIPKYIISLLAPNTKLAIFHWVTVQPLNWVIWYPQAWDLMLWHWVDLVDWLPHTSPGSKVATSSSPGRNLSESDPALVARPASAPGASEKHWGHGNGHTTHCFHEICGGLCIAIQPPLVIIDINTLSHHW